MNEQLNKWLETNPQVLSAGFFDKLNEALKDVCTEENPLNPLENAEVMYRCVANILATYVMNLVEPPLREYVSSRIVFHLATMLNVQIQTWEATNTAKQAVDNIGSI